MVRTVFALGCHPDDIEFVMAGTLFLLKEAGCELHCMSIANGSCGSIELSREQTIAIRKAEAMKAAALLGATYHESLANDLEIFYQQDLISGVAAVIREIKPDIMLIPSLEDYMEDHMNTARIAVTAAFAKGMPLFESIPARTAYAKDITLYHAMPYGLRNGMGDIIKTAMYVDVTSVIGKKREMLACHASQKQLIDRTQGIDNYLNFMEDMSKEAGTLSGTFRFAESWRKHNFLGYSATPIDPLYDALKKHTSFSDA